MNTHFLALCMLAWATCTGMSAETMEPNQKWGKPTEAELTMAEYEADKDADAAELYKTVDVSYGVVNGDFRVYYRVKCRLKVLKPEGKRVADVSISYREPETNRLRHEVVAGLKAVAYNLENGKLTKTKMESDMVHRERIDKEWMRLKFSVPQVRVGTVIEYEYRIESDFFYDLRDWYAQSDIPVLYTRYELSVPEWFSFNINETGMVRMESTRSSGNMDIEGTPLSTNERTFVGSNLPALKDDDYVWCARDYGCKVTHELKGIYVPGAVYKNYTSTWEDIDKMLMDDEEFGGRLKKSSPLKEEIVAAGIPQIADRQQRAAAVWQLLRKRVRWDGDYALWAKSGAKVLKEGTGSNADINFLYINMLHDAGLEAVPVVLRLRSLGRLPMTHASLKYLSTFVVGIADTDSTYCYMDASAEDGYLNVLPARLLVDMARIIRKSGSGEWLNLQAPARSQESTVGQAALGTDGLISGQRSSNYSGEAAARLRRKWRTAQDSTEVIHQMQEGSGAQIQSYRLDGRHDFSPKVREIVEFTKQCDTAGDMIYLNPFVFTPISNSPFTTTERSLPVEFPYPQKETLNVILTLPEGYTVEEVPKPIIVKVDGATARIISSLSGQQLTMQYQLTLSRIFYSQQQYGDLKAFFDKLVENCKYIVTLKKQ